MLTPPCEIACDAGEPVRGWLHALQADDVLRAWRMITRMNPLPACMGRICYAPCEQRCVLGARTGAVGIRALEAAVGELALREGWRLDEPRESTGVRVVVVGSGPCGLSATHQLVLAGHEVTLIDAAQGHHRAASAQAHPGRGDPAHRLGTRPRSDLARRAPHRGGPLEVRRRDLGRGSLPVHGSGRGKNDLEAADPHGSKRQAHGHAVDRPWGPGGRGAERPPARQRPLGSRLRRDDGRGSAVGGPAGSAGLIEGCDNQRGKPLYPVRVPWGPASSAHQTRERLAHA